MYYNGDGVPRDTSEAERLFGLAAAQGDEAAQVWVNTAEMQRRRREMHGDDAGEL